VTKTAFNTIAAMAWTQWEVAMRKRLRTTEYQQAIWLLCQLVTFLEAVMVVAATVIVAVTVALAGAVRLLILSNGKPPSTFCGGQFGI
jgi:hypothetical protein